MRHRCYPSAGEELLVVISAVFAAALIVALIVPMLLVYGLIVWQHEARERRERRRVQAKVVLR